MSQAHTLFEQFIRDVHAIWAVEPDMGKRMAQTKPLFEKLVREPAMQAESDSWPSTEGHKNLLFHTDETYGFIVNAVVREPNRKGSVHCCCSLPSVQFLRDARQCRSLCIRSRQE